MKKEIAYFNYKIVTKIEGKIGAFEIFDKDKKVYEDSDEYEEVDFEYLEELAKSWIVEQNTSKG